MGFVEHWEKVFWSCVAIVGGWESGRDAGDAFPQFQVGV